MAVFRIDVYRDNNIEPEEDDGNLRFILLREGNCEQGRAPRSHAPTVKPIGGEYETLMFFFC